MALRANQWRHDGGVEAGRRQFLQSKQNLPAVNKKSIHQSMQKRSRRRHSIPADVLPQDSAVSGIHTTILL